MKKHFLLRFMMLISVIWVVYANFGMMGSAADAILKMNSELTGKSDMQYIGRYVMMEYIDTGTLPRNVEELVNLIRRVLEADNRKPGPDVGKDKWGTYYRLTYEKEGIQVISAGPDRKWKTDDDIVFFQALTHVGYRGPATVRGHNTHPSRSARR